MNIKAEPFKKNYFLLALFVRNQITEVYKRMAKDEVLFKFMNNELDPLRLVDFHLQSEKMALELASKVVEEKMTEAQFEGSTKLYANKLDQEFSSLYEKALGKTVLFAEERLTWFEARFHFYRAWLRSADSKEYESVLDLARASFEQEEEYRRYLSKLIEAADVLDRSLVKEAPSIHRFLIQKQTNTERRVFLEVWDEFSKEAFRRPAVLKG